MLNDDLCKQVPVIGAVFATHYWSGKQKRHTNTQVQI